MSAALVPGSFDPPTSGHVDVFSRAAAQFDVLYVTVMVNPAKQTLFTLDERLEMLRESTAHIGNVRVESWQGLLVDFARKHAVSAIVKGLRSSGDLDYELPMAQMNRRLTGVDTLFLAADPAYGFLSSSLVKEVATHGGDVTGMLPESVHRRLLGRLAGRL